MVRSTLLSFFLFQVEYAMEAIGHAGTCLGILANDGILLAAERRNTNKLLDEVCKRHDKAEKRTNTKAKWPLQRIFFIFCVGFLRKWFLSCPYKRSLLHTFFIPVQVFHSEKIYNLNENMACSVAGITSDANVLTNELR